MKMMARYRILLPAALGVLLLIPQAFATSESEDEYRTVIKANVDASHGAILFETCARCHGANGAGKIDGTVPAIAGQHFRVIARQLVDYRHDERWDVYMEHFADFPTLIFTQDVADVAGYITGLERTGPRAQGIGESLDHGATLYGRRCASCHGAQGEGSDNKGYPRLAGQHYPYLVRQMHDALEVGAPTSRARMFGCCRASIETTSTAWRIISPGCRPDCRRWTCRVGIPRA